MAVRKRNPLVSQAQALAVVKYSPEEAALVQLLRQAQDTFHQGVAAAKGAAKYTVNTIDSSRPQLESVYKVPGLNPAQPAAAPELPAAGALDFRSASQFETQAAAHRMAQSRTDALAGLSQQKSSAAAGAQYGAQQARQQYLRDLGTVDSRLVQLSGEKGAYIASTFGTLEQQAAQRALTARGQTLSHQDRVRGQNLTHGDRVATRQAKQQASQRVKWATPAQHGAFHDAVAHAVAEAKRMKQAGHDRNYIGQQLVIGRSPQSIKDPSTGQSLTVPGVTKVPQLAASVALDLLFDGHVSRNNVRALHGRRLQIRQLGYPTRPAPQPPLGKQVAGFFQHALG